MIRQKLIDRKVGQTEFRWRSHEVSRIEGLSGWGFCFCNYTSSGFTGGSEDIQ